MLEQWSSFACFLFNQFKNLFAFEANKSKFTICKNNYAKWFIYLFQSFNMFSILKRVESTFNFN